MEHLKVNLWPICTSKIDENGKRTYEYKQVGEIKSAGKLSMHKRQLVKNIIERLKSTKYARNMFLMPDEIEAGITITRKTSKTSFSLTVEIEEEDYLFPLPKNFN